jgi:hypothetical protein
MLSFFDKFWVVEGKTHEGFRSKTKQEENFPKTKQLTRIFENNTIRLQGRVSKISKQSSEKTKYMT